MEEKPKITDLIKKHASNKIFVISAAAFILILLAGTGTHYYLNAKKERNETKDKITAGVTPTPTAAPTFAPAPSATPTTTPTPAAAPTAKPTPKATATPVPTPTPQARPVLYLPFAQANDSAGLIPMGETVYHPKPSNPYGHGGIDFQWNSNIPITAALAGTVDGIYVGYHPNTWDVVVKTGKYAVGYYELESYNPSLSVGSPVSVGTFIGYPQHPGGTHEGYRMIHWEFGYWNSTYPRYVNRFCPMTYFESASKVRIENIWAATQWEHKSSFPYICSGDYYSMNE